MTRILFRRFCRIPDSGETSMRKYVVALYVLASMVSAGEAAADVRLPSVFGGNMVLQRDVGVPVWGWADPGEKVTVAIADQEVSTRAGDDGRWQLEFEPMHAGGPHEFVVRGNNEIVCDNVMIGEVWLCSGQSNMEMMVRHSKDAENEVAAADHPRLRLFQMTNTVSPEPLDDCEGSWEVCRPSTVGNFSAAAYYFGRELQSELTVPVGLINASWGGTTAETWMTIVPLTENPDFRFILYRWDEVMKERSPEVVEYFNDMGAWHEDLYHQITTGMFRNKRIVPPRPAPEAPTQLMWLPHVPTWLYNGMIAPVVPYAIRGAIWYQGESNAGRAYQYRSLFPALIADWRRVWGQGDFPFVYTQISAYGIRHENPVDCAWAELREAQLMALDVSNTAMAVTIDIGEADDIHPRNKQDVGRRLALGALKVAYGRDIVYSGPLYESARFEEGRAYLRFTNSESGLAARTGESLRSFTVAGPDSVFVRAKAMITGDEIVVWNSDIRQPVAVRYGWDNFPDCNLYNREGLPASPFRTDDWPGITADAK